MPIGVISIEQQKAFIFLWELGMLLVADMSVEESIDPMFNQISL